MYTESGDGLTTTLGAMHLRPPTRVSETDTLVTVASAMLRDSVSCAVLEQPPLRVVTEHDLSAAWACGCQAQDHVSLIATVDPSWALASASVAEAAALMVRLGIRHLIVVDGTGRPVGTVSMSELFSVLVRAQEPISLYASFATILLQSATEQTGEHTQGRSTPP